MNNRAEIYSIQEFISLKKIRIPEYQRPYKWNSKNVVQLIDDIHSFRKKSHYRFGTIVIHENSLIEDDVHTTYHDIVDGQQRYTTLRLLIYALCQQTKDNSRYQGNTRNLLQDLKIKLDAIAIEYTNKTSIQTINENYQLIKRSIQNFDDETITNFVLKFQVVVFFITDETEAFQFFDSQNSRGKDLYPHDLLKAYHLREFDSSDRDAQTRIVDHWEKYTSSKLAALFSDYLFRIKGWSNSRSSRYFGKQHIDLFKGISIDKIESFPYVKAMQIAHHLVDNYNENVERKIDRQYMSFPFQIDQLMINGRRFFEYIDYYLGINERFKEKFLKPIGSLDSDCTSTELLVKYVYRNQYSYREGESYLKDLFECVTIYYIDKFGENELQEFIEKAFVWCYYLRFEYQRLGFDSVDNYVIKNNLFLIIKNAIQPKEVIKAPVLQLPGYQQIEDFSKEGSRRIDQRIVTFFKSNNYYAN
ncbi:DUF262 domain-containing protein [uncultured Fluviicola sp.]|uniref:DUF262 domain-containing protein n=1 Tax=uncultured Fluviicola sp. TaxID=463303 RepID=UPI0025FF7E7B|nr:DUF262 domain-containing protein [uncultured Fluviicola sp.]